MTHYTCTECGVEEDSPNVCETGDCLKRGQELTACECSDGDHGGENEEEYYSH
ncbi:MAG: hypothetical protein HYZ63_01350 [Candidatus Andersenbacteria bacterium]|nr:hypothetical protein [Candidatus Andersenbacteria bacterium]